MTRNPLTNLGPWVRTRVHIYIDDGDLDAMGPFEAFIRERQRWNGWLCPFFTREEAERVAAWLNHTREVLPDSPGTRMTWDEARQAFCLDDSDYAPEGMTRAALEDEGYITYDAGTYIEELGGTFYAPGWGGWCWEDGGWQYGPFLWELREPA